MINLNNLNFFSNVNAKVHKKRVLFYDDDGGKIVGAGTLSRAGPSYELLRIIRN